MMDEIIEEEVLGPLPPKTRKFERKTAILGFRNTLDDGCISIEIDGVEVCLTDWENFECMLKRMTEIWG